MPFFYRDRAGKCPFLETKLKIEPMDIKSLTRRVPALHRILRACYRRVSGRLIGDKIDDLTHRLDRIERILSNERKHALGADSTAFVMQHALASLRDRQTERPDAIAVVSILPPDKSGIAHFSLESFSAAGYPVDIYSPRLGLANYLELSARMEQNGGLHRVLPLELLSYGLSTLDYSACIFVLGNSDHNLAIYRAFRQWGQLAKLPIIHLHDPCLWNLVLAERPKDDIGLILRDTYPELALPPGVIGVGEALDIGALGARVLLGQYARHGVIVNSEAAYQLLSRELSGASIRTVFHPIFQQPVRHNSRNFNKSGPLRIGSFGIPDMEKCTETVLSAFSKLRSRRPDAELLLVGYGAPAYLRSLGFGPEQGVFASEPEDNDELVEIMSSCHVAVQLRRRNLGESSGVMAQLMCTRTPVVAFDIGAFGDYRGAVRLIPRESTDTQIADAIIQEYEVAPSRNDTMAKLIEERSPFRFCDAFRSAIADLSRVAV
ncbi:glycosyltransferase [Acidiphilium multivorum]|uniref:glycosyltransferase n=1 Tax=Acidiphilium multivorum TaxID=62140 RepID=UPI003211B9CC